MPLQDAETNYYKGDRNGGGSLVGDRRDTPTLLSKKSSQSEMNKF